MYRLAENPPVLHRKETFLAPTHALFTKFARLTRQEERHGLLDNAATIGTRAGWPTWPNPGSAWPAIVCCGYVRHSSLTAMCFRHDRRVDFSPRELIRVD